MYDEYFVAASGCEQVLSDRRLSWRGGSWVHVGPRGRLCS